MLCEGSASIEMQSTKITRNKRKKQRITPNHNIAPDPAPQVVNLTDMVGCRPCNNIFFHIKCIYRCVSSGLITCYFISSSNTAAKSSKNVKII